MGFPELDKFLHCFGIRRGGVTRPVLVAREECYEGLVRFISSCGPQPRNVSQIPFGGTWLGQYQRLPKMCKLEELELHLTKFTILLGGRRRHSQ